jgi:hypothetical protein
MRRKYIFIVFFLLLIANPGLFAYRIFHGSVRDFETKEPLPTANIQIEGTYRGTITNDDGFFSIRLDSLPATLVISYIGYKTEKLLVENSTEDNVAIDLISIPLQSKGVVVTGQDPAINIMRKVIEKKQEMKDKLKSFKADIYMRTFLSNEDSLTHMLETVSEIYWDKDRGFKEIVKSRKESAKLQLPEVGLEVFLNLYDEEIEVIGFKFINIVHPDALKYYDFKLLSERQLEDKFIYEISVEPKDKLQPLGEGKVTVQSPDYVLLSVDLKPAGGFRLPPEVRSFRYNAKQQFSNFGKDYWLPVSLLEESREKFGDLLVSYSELTGKTLFEIRNYKVNIPIPDSLYENNKKIYSKETDTLLIPEGDKVPFAREEKKAYENSDSTITAAEMLNPKGLFAPLARKALGEMFGDTTQKTIDYSISPVLWRNRVEGKHYGAHSIIYYKNLIGLQLGFGITENAEGFSDYPLKVGFISKYLDVNYFRGTDVRSESNAFSNFITVLCLRSLSKADYFDYYWNKGIRGKLKYDIKKIQTKLALGVNLEKHSSTSNMPEKEDARPNPAITEGALRSLSFEFSVGRDSVLHTGKQNELKRNNSPAFKLFEKNFSFKVEHSSPNIFDSDYSFTRGEVSLGWRFNTFLKRRIFPNTLDLKLIAGGVYGDPPIQKHVMLYGTAGSFSEFGIFRSLRPLPLEGEKYAAILAEHNFRTVPFELLGLDFIASLGLEIIVYGAAGRTWFSEEKLSELSYTPSYYNGYMSEVGFSINKVIPLFPLARLDFTYNNQNKNFYMGFGIAKMF